MENDKKKIISPGDLLKSELADRIRSNRASHKMPPPESNLILSERDKLIIEKWIAQGAKWESHWAYVLPSKPEENLDFLSNIDHFVLKELEEKGLNPSNEASKEFLLRRLYFDIIGLPPTIEQMDAFLADESEDAYEKVVNELLISPAYGERMASKWMDVARYADTNGYQDDTERTMWPWRDWVIHAYNNNMPYDQFVTWQLAGDLLPNANKEQILATGFNRNHMITQEGGVIEEEYRVEYVADRTITTAKTFLGLTVECARCHDHKYDEISQKDFFNLFDFFNRLDEDGVISYTDKAPKPNIKLDYNLIKEELPFIKIPDSISELDLMVMKEVQDLRKTYLLNRGSYDSPTEIELNGSMPSVIMPFKKNFEKNRLGLSKWLFDPNNPITARVAVNRIWQQFFGIGIVSTSSDFGNQGALPTHPELLDWLSVKYIEEGWDTKRMIKRIVMSNTYKQSSKPTPLKIKIDPKNYYLSYYPRQKLTAEMIRDNILVSSGLFNNKLGGPSVKPYQPPGLWDELTGGSTSNSLKRYIMSTNGNQYRRSLYTYWKRTAPPPGMITFDAATRDFCAVERQRTSTPLQSLILLNDPQVQNAANALASNILSKDLKSDRNRVYKLHRMITGRSPEKKALNEMINYLKEVKKIHLEDNKSMSLDQIKLDQKVYTSMILLIYNLDETSQKS
jgi:isopentenyldiphosphate isomerase